MLTIAAFIVALAVLIAVHEYGHYRMAVACGVPVLRFSIGFGPVLLRWKPRRQRPGQDTEFTIAALPLGGFVRMLDEREGPVADADKARAFNNQAVGRRALIVAAGPAANLLLAIVLYAAMNWYGVQESAPVLSRPAAGSAAEAAGLRGGERVDSAAFDGESLAPVRSFEQLRWLLTRAALDGHDVRLAVAAEPGTRPREVLLPLQRLPSEQADAALQRAIGMLGAWTRPVIAEVVDGEPAQRAGLREGDLVLAVGETPIADGSQLFQQIRALVRDGKPLTLPWRIQRDGRELLVDVEPRVMRDGDAVFGRIGARVGSPPERVLVRYGFFEGARNGVVRTWQMSALTVRMIGRMLIGQASLKNISGPITIAEYAGKSASIGLEQYLLYLAVISVSLGVLNLLPVPVLDGGHLMYYLWEAVTGKGVSDAWMERLQRGGVAALLVMISIALFNDVTRLLG